MLHTFGDDEREAAEDDGDVMMPSSERTSLEVIETKLAFQLFINALRAPTLLGDAHDALALPLAEDAEGVHGEGFPLALVPQTGANLSEIRLEARDTGDVELVAHAPDRSGAQPGPNFPQ
jgi:hypothetical protein